MSSDPYDTAKRRVDQLLGLAIHALAFLAVNAVMFAQDGFEPAAGRFWGWGIGVAGHTLVVLAPASRVRERLIASQLARTNPASHTRAPDVDIARDD